MPIFDNHLMTFFPSSFGRKWAWIVSIAFSATLFLIVILYFTSLQLASWAVAEWQRRSPLPGFRLELISLDRGNGELAVHSTADGKKLLQIPFHWRWKLFPPAISLTVNHQWNRVVFQDYSVDGIMVNATTTLSPTGRWSIQSTVAVDAILGAFGKVTGVGIDFFLSRDGGNLTGKSVTGEINHSWKMEIGATDISLPFPANLSGTLRSHATDVKSEVAFEIGRGKWPPVARGTATVSLKGNFPISNISTNWELSDLFELIGVIEPKQIESRVVRLRQPLRWQVVRAENKPLRVQVFCGRRFRPCLEWSQEMGNASIDNFSFDSRWNLEGPSKRFQAVVQLHGLRIEPQQELSGLSRLPRFSVHATLQGLVFGKMLAAASIKSDLWPWVWKGKGEFQNTRSGVSTLKMPLRFSTRQELAWIQQWGLDPIEGAIDLSIHARWLLPNVRVWWEATSDALAGAWDGIPFSVKQFQLGGELYPKFSNVGSNFILVDKVGEKLRLEDLKIEMAWKNMERLEVTRFIGRLAKGDLISEPFIWDRTSGKAKSIFVLQNLELSALCSTLIGDGVKAEGRIYGEIPWSWGEGDLRIEKAQIRNHSAGRIQYTDERVRQVKEKIEYLEEFNALLAQGQQMLVLKALNNFHYTVLQLSANRSADRGLEVTLRLKGRNPDLAKGQLFDITLPVTGNLESLLRETIWKAFLGE